VGDGFTPPVVGKTDPSQMKRLRMSQLAAVGIHDTRARIVAYAAGADHVAGVVLLLPDVRRADRLERAARTFTPRAVESGTGSPAVCGGP